MRYSTFREWLAARVDGVIEQIDWQEFWNDGPQFAGVAAQEEGRMTANEAELAIGKILSAFEKERGDWVTAIKIKSIEVTRLESPRREFKRRVVLVYEPAPGCDWAEG